MATLKDYALTNLADVKENLNIASSNHTYDNLIIRKINQATAMIETYCGRRFAAADYTDEIYNATRIDQIVLKQRPVIVSGNYTVTLKARDTSLNQNDFETLDTQLYFVDQSAGILDLLFRAIGRWGAYTVSYRAGYATIPDDLAEAAASLTAYLVNVADASNVGTKSKTEGQRKLEYSMQPITGALDIFKRLGIDEVINAYANQAIYADK